MAVIEYHKIRKTYFRFIDLLIFKTRFLHILLGVAWLLSTAAENRMSSQVNLQKLSDKLGEITGEKPVTTEWTSHTGASDTSRTLDDRLIRACISGDLELVKKLVTAGANPAGRDLFGRTPLMYAARFGTAKVAEYLCSQHIDVNEIRVIQNDMYGSGNVDMEAKTALMEAALNGDSATACILLAADANIHEQNISGNSALFYAAQEGNSAIVRMLLAKGAVVDSLNYRKETALSYAVKSGKGSIIDTLLSFGGKKPKFGTLMGALCAAIVVNDTSMVQKFLHAGAHCDSVFYGYNNARYTPLILAVQLGRGEIVQLFLRRGANVNVIVEGRTTALLAAAEAADTAMIKLLLQNGAKTDLNLNGTMGLLWTVYEKNLFSSIKMILDRGVRSGEFENVFRNILYDGSYSIEKTDAFCYLFPIVAGKVGINLNSTGFLDTMHSGLKDSYSLILQIKGLECLKQKGVSIDFNKLEIPGLLIESAMGRIDGIVRELGENTPRNIFREIKINERYGSRKWNALYCAIVNGQPEAVKYLVKNGADVNSGLDSTGAREHISETLRLIAGGALLPPPLELALLHRMHDIVDYLIQKGAQLPVKSVGNMSPDEVLSHTLYRGRADVLRPLPLLHNIQLQNYSDLFYEVAGKKDTDLHENDYKAAFFIAAVRGQDSVAGFLLEKYPWLKTSLFDTTVFGSNNFGVSAFRNAVDFGHTSFFKLMIKKFPHRSWYPLLPNALVSAERFGYREIADLILRLAYEDGFHID